METQEARLTIRSLQDMVRSMLKIYPPLEERIQGFETLVAQNFLDTDVARLKEVIIQACETIRKADAREVEEVSKLRGIKDARVKRRLNSVLGLIQLQMAKIKALEAGIDQYEKDPSHELTRIIGRLNQELKDLLKKEDKELGEIERLAA